jgi:hypothetical protein
MTMCVAEKPIISPHCGRQSSFFEPFLFRLPVLLVLFSCLSCPTSPLHAFWTFLDSVCMVPFYHAPRIMLRFKRQSRGLTYVYGFCRFVFINILRFIENGGSNLIECEPNYMFMAPEFIPVYIIMLLWKLSTFSIFIKVGTTAYIGSNYRMWDQLYVRGSRVYTCIYYYDSLKVVGNCYIWSSEPTLSICIKIGTNCVHIASLRE